MTLTKAEKIVLKILRTYPGAALSAKAIHDSCHRSRRGYVGVEAVSAAVASLKELGLVTEPAVGTYRAVPPSGRIGIGAWRHLQDLR